MPPAVSDDERGSDLEMDAPVSATKKTTREKKPVAYKEPVPEDIDADSADEQNGNADDAGGDEDEDDDEAEGPEEYVVEKILSHMINNEGEPLFEVKWEGYEKKSDRTWEPEENLRENASLILDEYFASIGGRDALFESSKTALKTKKRGRPSTSGGTPQASGKRTKRNGSQTADSDTPLSAKAATWKPPPGSWEDHIAQLDACEDEETGKLMVYLTWKNGHKTQHETSVIYRHCPQKMLQFYEKHVVIKRVVDTV